MRRDSLASAEDERTILEEINGKIRKCFMNAHQERSSLRSRCSSATGELYSNDKVQEDVYLTDKTVPKLNLLNNSLTARLRKTLPAEVLTNDEAMHRIRRDTVKDIVRMRILRKQWFTEASRRAAVITGEEQSLIQRHYQMRQHTKELNRQAHEQLLKKKLTTNLPGTKTLPSHKTPRSVSSLYSFDADKSLVNPLVQHIMYERKNKEDRIEVDEAEMKKMIEKMEVASLRRSGTNASIGSSKGRAVTASTSPEYRRTIPSLRSSISQTIPNRETTYKMTRSRATSRVTFNAPSEASERTTPIADDDVFGADEMSAIESLPENDPTKPKPPPMPFERYAIRPLSNTSRHSVPSIRSPSRASRTSTGQSPSYTPSLVTTDSGVSVAYTWPRRSAGSSRAGKRTKNLHPVATGLNNQGRSVEKTRFKALNTKGDIKVAKVWTRKRINSIDPPIVWAREDTHIDEPPASPFC